MQELPFQKRLSSVVMFAQCGSVGTQNHENKPKKPYLRKAEEKGGGPNQEGGGCWHRNISAGSKWTGRGRDGATYSSPNHGTTESRHQRDKHTERKGGGRQRGGRCLQAINGSFSGQKLIYDICWRQGGMTSDWKRKKKQLFKAAT